MPVARFVPFLMQEGLFITYFLLDTPHASHSIWMIPGTWREG